MDVFNACSGETISAATYEKLGFMVHSQRPAGVECGVLGLRPALRRPALTAISTLELLLLCRVLIFAVALQSILKVLL